MRASEKFGEVAPPSPKVVGAHTPNFKPNFEFWLSQKNYSGGTPIFEPEL